MEKKIDRISELPDNVAEEILCHLSTRDAVRTSVLSREWRHKWTTTPAFVFGDKFTRSSCVFYSVKELVSRIDHVLSHHVGPIHIFKLYYDIKGKIKSHVPHHKILPNRDIDRWLSRVTNSHIKELSLRFYYQQHYTLPSCVFSCQALTKLELSCCTLRPPKKYKGFENLKSLNFTSVTLAQDVLETLICKSPMLESAVLSVDLGDNSSQSIDVNAPNLRFFKCLGKRIDHITFRNTSRLAVVDILWAKLDRSRPLEISWISGFFDHLLQLRSLKLKGAFLEYLAFGGLPRTYPLHNLQYLLMSVNFNHQNEILGALCLIKSAPDLQELDIWVDQAKSNIENEEPNHLEDDGRSCLFRKVQRVRIGPVIGCEGEIDFINYMLSSSPALETMTIKCLLSCPRSTVKQSLCSEHASKRAVIIVEF